MKTKPTKASVYITDMEPIGKSVLIERIYEPVKTTSGIIISETTKEPRPVGILIAVGEEVKEKLQKSIGCKVVFNRFENLEITDSQGKTMLMMDQASVYCLIKDDTLVMDASAETVKRIDIDNSGN